MRKLRVVIAGGAVPALAATVIGGQGCGGIGLVEDGGCEAAADAKAKDTGGDGPILLTDAPPDDTGVDTGPEPLCGYGAQQITHIVTIPPAGVPADPGQLCAVTTPPVASNTAARVTLTSYSPKNDTAIGYVAIPQALMGQIVGLPSITVTQANPTQFGALQVKALAPANGGYDFLASWSQPIPHLTMGGTMQVKTTLTVKCPDGGTQTVESITNIDFCVEGETFAWVSSGDACTICQIIAEMAPSPIASDNRGDELPLGRVLRLRVVELARAGRTLLLLAENDGGAGAEYEWRVSGGALERVADDLVLWRLPDDADAPFGQVAVWNDAGASVENFAWGAA